MSGKLTLYPLGGLGEIGMNCMGFMTDESFVLVDCGLMFPEDYLYGVDVAIPNIDFIIAHKAMLKGIVLTHGHEDHIGALPWLQPFVHVPIYGSDFTLGLVANKLREHDLLRYTELVTVKPHERIQLGDMAFNFLPVCHSIINGFGLGIETPVGRVVHTGDFKIDRYPIGGQATDIDAFRAFAEPGVQLLLSDSTNVERDGYALTEREIKSSLKDIFKSAEGRILITLFSSHIQRIQEVFELAAAFGRKVALSGRSMVRNIELAREMGQLHIPAGTFISLDELSDYRDHEVVLLVTGTQGEPMAALSRMAVGEHRRLSIKDGDLVLLSSRFIPGNEKAITKVINGLYKLGAEVVYERASGIHASGHAHSEELRIMLETVQPKYFVPVHGEYRHLVKHSRLAVECGVAKERAVIIEDGQPITFAEDGVKLEPPFNAEKVLVDGKGVGDVCPSLLKERQLLAGEGLLIVVLVVDEETGEIMVGPDLLSRGFVFEEQYSHLLEDAKCLLLDVFENVPPGQTQKLEEKVRSTLRRFFRKVLDRDPVVVPVILTL